jgi:hypothetical protein
MLDELPRKTIPDWLRNFEADREDVLPLRHMLEGSVYYPACGVDGRPVQYCASHSFSFVYADYGVSKERLSAALSGPGGFKGYSLGSGRFIEAEQLAPSLFDGIEDAFSCGDDPGRFIHHRVRPYAYWGIFERLPGFGHSGGPDLFSFLFVAADGVATYRNLYHGHNTRASLIAVIQPGEGFGFNWTNFYDPDRAFANVVLCNPNGVPDYMIYGGIGSGTRYRMPSWPQYGKLLRFWKTTDGHLGLWGKNDAI